MMSKLFIPAILLILSTNDNSAQPNQIFVNAFSANFNNGFKNTPSSRKVTNSNFGVEPLKFLSHENRESFLSLSNSDNDDKERKIENKQRRLSFLGASVSPTGFIALLSTSSTNGASMVLPIRISMTSDDEFSASSVEALAFLQLLAGVDMASEGVLPVQLLERIVALFCSLTSEEDEDDEKK